MLISPSYRALVARLHLDRPDFGTGGHRWAKAVVNAYEEIGIKSVLDYGAGRGTLKAAVMETYLKSRMDFSFAEYDPAIPEISAPPDPADLVVCSDVIEHIEPECLDDVLTDIHRLARQYAMLVIATKPAKKTLADGRNAHLIVQPLSFWATKIEPLWRLRSIQGNGDAFIFLGETR